MCTCAFSRLTWQSVFGGGKRACYPEKHFHQRDVLLLMCFRGTDKKETVLHSQLQKNIPVCGHTGCFTLELSVMGESVNKKGIPLNRNRIQTLPEIQVSPANRATVFFVFSFFQISLNELPARVHRNKVKQRSWKVPLSFTPLHGVKNHSPLLQPKDPPSLHRKPIKLSGC